MSLFRCLRAPDVNQGVEEFQKTKGAVLLDVRTPEEYWEGHIPGSENIPLQQLETVTSRVQDKSTSVFVYCLSGGRSGQASRRLKKMGYENVTNIGGISAYRGRRER